MILKTTRNLEQKNFNKTVNLSDHQLLIKLNLLTISIKLKKTLIVLHVRCLLFI